MGLKSRKWMHRVLHVLVFVWVCLLGAEAMAWFPLWVGGRCQESRFVCRSTLGNAGGRGACCDPGSPGAETCSRKDACVGTYQYHWDNARLPLKWNINFNNMAGRSGFRSATNALIEQEAKRAWDAWTQPTCSAFRHAYQGATSKSPSPSDRIVTIYLPDDADWARLGAAGALAFSSPVADSQGRIIDADIVFNPNPLGGWGFPPVPTNSVDFTEVLAHEAGHSIGLAHSPLFSALMYYSVRGSGPQFKGIGQDDRDGVCTLYPGNNKCTQTSDCAPCFQCLNGLCAAPDKPIARLCLPCDNDAACGTNGTCLSTPEGGRCVQACSGACCPSGYHCEQTSGKSLCLPLESSCPVQSCKDSSTCGSNGFCDATLQICRAPKPFDPLQCSRTCSKDADCGSASYFCVEYASGYKRCLAKCENLLCPSGYSCRQSQVGQHCIPTNPDFCPCDSITDCPAERTCRNRLCVSRNGGQFGEPCSDEAPCATGLQCEPLEGGQKCVIPCDKVSCPDGLECLTLSNFQRICAKTPSRQHGETCDGLQRRCITGLTCVSVLADQNEAYCVEICALSTVCQNGGKCNLDGVPRFCQCTSDDECGVGFLCRTLISGVRICDCETKPCKRGCGNGACETNRGESCTTCPEDCSCADGFSCNEGICRKEAVCGDGVCEVEKGEHCANCAKDCKCGFGELCIGNICKAPTCGDSICSPNQNEDCFTCAKDCACQAGLNCHNGRCTKGICGDGTCDTADGENCSTCAQDCACHPLATCGNDGRCRAGNIPSCGNGLCEPSQGETCFTCVPDCGCRNRFVCRSGDCVEPNSVCPANLQELQCPPSGENCTLKCRSNTGCGCQQTPDSSGPFSWLLAWVALFGLIRLYRKARIPVSQET